MALIATLDISVGATTKRLQTGLSKARGMVTSFARGIGKLGVGIAAGFGVAAGAAGALAFQVNRSFEEIDQLAKTSSKLDIGVDRLQGLRHAAEKAGVASSAFDTALQRQTRRLADAARVGGPLADRLEEMGLNVETLARMSPDQAFLKISDAMAGLETQAEKVSLAFQVYDTEGVGLVNLSNQGAEAIDKQSRMLEKFGLQMTGPGAAAVEAYNDMWADLGEILDASIMKLGAEMAPILTSLAQYFGDTEDAAFDLGGTIEAVADFVAGAIGKVLDFGNMIQGVFMKAQANLTEFGSFMTGLTADLLDGINAVREALGTGELVNTDYLRNVQKQLGDEAEDLGAKAWEKFNSGWEGEASAKFGDIVAANQKRYAEIADKTIEAVLPPEEAAVIRRATQGPGLALRGTQAAFQATQRRNDIGDKLDVGNREAKKQTEELKKISKAMSGGTVVTIPAV